MATDDLRLDVPARAFINAQLLSLIEGGATFLEAKKHLFSIEPYRGTGLDAYTWKIHDHALAMGLLYCLIVVPREILSLPENHRLHTELDAEKVTDLFNITEPKPIDSCLFLRCLRNSVAHGLFSIKQSRGDIEYEFWTDHKPIMRARINHTQLLHFMAAVGSRLGNAVLDLKKGQP